LFAVRDDIARRIVQAVGIKIGSGDQTDLKGDDMSLEAWLLMKEASEFANEPSPKNLRRGREIMERVVKMEPDIAKAYVWLSVLTRLEVQLGSSKDPEADMQKAREAAQKAKELKPDDGGSYTALSNWYIMRGQHDEGVNAIRQAVKLEPGNAPIVGTGAMVYFYAGDYQEAIRHGQRALRMLPRSRLHWIMAQVGSAMQISGDLKGAEKIWREMLSTDPAAFWVGISKQQLAIIAGDRGDDMMGRQLVEEALKAAPYLTQAGMRQRSPMRDPNALDPWLNTLDRLGLPAK
jgi:tetratricopeptide (TPR) repeat protein